MTIVSMTVKGEPVSGVIEGHTLPLSVRRWDMRQTGTHIGCDTLLCGFVTPGQAMPTFAAE